MLDASSSAAMTAPGIIADDPVAPEHRRHELGHAAVPAVGQDAPMRLAELLDG